MSELISEVNARQIGQNMVITHAYTPASVNVGDKVRVTHGDKTIFTEVISVRRHTMSPKFWLIGVKGIVASLYVNENYQGGSYVGAETRILKIRHTVTPITDYMDALEILTISGLF